jgi:hypothetical protein
MSKVQIAPDVTLAGFHSIATNPITRDGAAEEMQLLNIADPVSGVGASVTAAGAAGINAQSVQSVTGAALAADGTDGTGISPPTGAVGIRGWLSGIYKLLLIPVLPLLAAQDGTDATGVTPLAGALGIRGWLSGIYKYMTQALVAGSLEDSVSVGGLNTTITTLSGATSASPLYLKATSGRLCRVFWSSSSPLPSSSTITFVNQASGAASAANVLYTVAGCAAGQSFDFQIPCGAGIGVYQSGGTLPANLVITWS